tara:strand:- start:9537 stop:9944 length:408 start_codon:yes stop_codon:yes gene_type:complete
MEKIPDNMGKAVNAYVNLRTHIQELEQKHKEALEGLREQLEVVHDDLLEFCTRENIDSIRTPFGTLSRRVTSSFWVSDWEEVYKVIAEHNAPFLLKKSINNSNMAAFLKDNPDTVVEGMQSRSKYRIQIRKPTKK